MARPEWRNSGSRNCSSGCSPCLGAPCELGCELDCPEAALPKRSDIEAALRRLAPRIPPHEFGAVVDHAVDSSGLRASSPVTAAWLSLVAYVRHAFTAYDDLLAQGYDQDSARFFVADAITAVLGQWGVTRRLSAD